ncbi:MAG: carbohydrate ABC transporter permease [Lachnospiraceae bacterium]|nr:carbohydrate ABC transporter permease [Lachnospiraceae bacterium]MBR6271321.1 carbohydrate ABC transporter permease [Lachnospiraceae bacterium]
MKNTEFKPKKHKKVRWWIPVICIVIFFMYIWPFYELIIMSIKDITDISSSKMWLSQGAHWENYLAVIKKSDIWIGFKNSIIYTGATIFLEITFASMAGYSLSRGSKKTTRTVRAVQMALLMVPGIITLVGTYSLMVNLGLTNSLLALAFLTAAGGIPGCSFIYMNFINSIPRQLDEAARIDGAGLFTTFFRVILPQLTPLTVTRAIMIGIGAWNNYLLPLYLLNDSRKRTIILVIRSAFSINGGDRDIAMACATCTIGILPVIVVYLLLQKKIIASQIGSSVKG